VPGNRHFSVDKNIAHRHDEVVIQVVQHDIFNEQGDEPLEPETVTGASDLGPNRCRGVNGRMSMRDRSPQIDHARSRPERGPAGKGTFVGHWNNL